MTTKSANWDWMKISKIPAASCGVNSGIERYLTGKLPAYTSATGASQAAAAAKSTVVEAWRVMHTQSRSVWRGCIERMKQREKTIGWIIRTTQYSRWAGENTTVEYAFVLGDSPGNLSTFDCRFADPVEHAAVGDSLELWRIQNMLNAEWAA